MPRFEIVVGSSRRGADEAAKDAERKARKAGGEQISIAADVCCGSAGTDPQVAKLLNNIAKNIYACQCPKQTIIGEKIKVVSRGVAPPPFISGGPGPSAPLWVVYILIKHV